MAGKYSCSSFIVQPPLSIIKSVFLGMRSLDRLIPLTTALANTGSVGDVKIFSLMCDILSRRVSIGLLFVAYQMIGAIISSGERK